MNVFVDTSGLLAVLDRDDKWHPKAATSWIELLSSDKSLVTTNYVLLELFAIVQNRLGMKALTLLQEDVLPVFQVEYITDKIHSSAIGLLFAASRRKLSLVDCVSFETMRLLKIKTAFTFDKHFHEHGFSCIPA